MLESEYTTDALPSPPRTKKKYPGNGSKRKTKVPESDEEKQEEINNTRPSSRQLPSVHVNNYSVHISNTERVHIGNVYNGTATSQKPVFKETEKIRFLKNSTKPVTNEDIRLVSEHMCADWKDTAFAFKYTPGQLDNFESQYPNNQREVKFQFLRDWMENNANDATVGLLAQTLWNNSQREAVQKWSEEYKIQG